MVIIIRRASSVVDPKRCAEHYKRVTRKNGVKVHERDNGIFH